MAAATGFPSDETINEILESHGVRWHGENVAGLSFLGNGKARQSWDRFAAKGMNGYWDRIGRVNKTVSGTEWLLVKKYGTMSDCNAKALGFSCSPRGVIRTKACNDLEYRISTIEFLRHKGVCCRMLLLFPGGDKNEAVAKSEVNRIGVWSNPKIKNRVFFFHCS